MVRQGVQLHATHYNHRDKADEEHQATHQTEEMHRLFAELIEEPDGEHMVIHSN